MGYNVLLQPSGIKFPVDEGTSLLESAIKSNIHLEHSCMDGSCGACKAKLVKGSIKQLKEPVGLTEDDKNDGYILTCCSDATSDLELAASYYPQLSEIKKMIQPCKVESLAFPASDIAILRLKIPPTANFKFLAGQYIQLIIKGQRRSYSIANISETYSGIELHIRKVVGGLFSEFIFTELKVNQLLRFEGPIGSFFVRDGSAPLIFLAGGTGFAPVKSMVEQLIEGKSNREIFIYWGSSTESGFYSDEAEKWQRENENIHYVPVFSGDGIFEGKKGLVHNAIMDDFDNLSKYEVYACGSADMINAAKRDFVLKGLNPDNYYSDAFVSSD